MRIVTKIITTIAICFLIGTVGYSIYILSSPLAQEHITTPVIDFDMNIGKRTLTVSEINFNTDWDYVYTDGYANLPEGSINLGDVISNCFGTVKLFFSGYCLGAWEFDETTDSFDDILFVGEWVGGNQEYEFETDGSIMFNGPEEYGEEEGTMISINGTYKNADLSQKLAIKTESADIKLFSYLFEEDGDTLLLFDENESFIYSRQINKVRTMENAIDYSGQKVNVTGNFTTVENETNGYLSIDEIFDIIIIFNNYSEGNATMHNGKKVEIIGFIFEAEEIDTWDTPYIDYIESIRVINN